MTIPLLVESLDFHAHVRPEAVAVIDDSGVTTYQGLHDLVGSLVAAMDRAGLPERVGLRAGNSVLHVAALYALPASGRACVVFDPKWTQAEVIRATAGFSVSHVLTDGPHSDALDVTGLVVHDLAELTAQDAEPGRKLRTVTGADGTHLISPSGGTSGRIKGSRLTHAATVARIATQLVEFGIPHAGTFVASTPLYHGSARSLGLGYLYCGGTLRLMGRFDVERWLEAATTATATFCVPTMLRRLVAAAQAPLGPQLRLLTGGAPIEPELAQQVRERLSENFFDYYASVESGPITVRHPGENALPVGCVGRPAFGVNVSIEDPDERGVGRIVVSGAGISTGFEGEVDPRLVAADAVRMDDLGRLDRHGRLHLHGRADDVIISGGVNVDPAEVEAALEEHPAIVGSAVVGLADPEWGHRVAAAIVTIDGHEVASQELDEHVRSRLAAPKRPKLIGRVDSLPLTPIGKLDRRAVADILMERQN